MATLYILSSAINQNKDSKNDEVFPNLDKPEQKIKIHH